MKRTPPSPRPRPPKVDSGLCCSFCGKGVREVKKLVAGPTVYICEVCVALCVDICREDNVDPLLVDYDAPRIRAIRAKTARDLAAIYEEARAELIADAEALEKPLADEPAGGAS